MNHLQITFYGTIFSKEGMKLTLNKCKESYECPSDVQLQSILAMINFIQVYIPHPLYYTALLNNY